MMEAEQVAEQVLGTLKERPPMESDDVLLDLKQTAEYLGLTESTVNTYASRGRILSVKMNDELAFYLSDLDKYREASPGVRNDQVIRDIVEARSQQYQPPKEQPIHPVFLNPQHFLRKEPAESVVSSKQEPMPVPMVCLRSEQDLMHCLIDAVFAGIPDLRSLPIMVEVPRLRTWKVDALTAEGVKTYQLVEQADGTFEMALWP